ncbi:hypothetical protein BDZ45DRAFT_799210 [Acephala macrosclerotiorum]|nr:hypothetical protein BDZ45DRAFT_799210 [Acephala macrosclerotiorum]
MATITRLFHMAMSERAFWMVASIGIGVTPLDFVVNDQVRHTREKIRIVDDDIRRKREDIEGNIWGSNSQNNGKA